MDQDANIPWMARDNDHADGVEAGEEDQISDWSEILEVTDENLSNEYDTELARDKPQLISDYLPGPPGYDALKFKNILQHDTFKKYVREVQVYTCESNCVSIAVLIYLQLEDWRIV